MCVVNTDAPTHQKKDPESASTRRNGGRRRCIWRLASKQFPPFVASVDGMMGVEAIATLKGIVSRLATKWK